ncbi:DUF6314 family protein [Rubellimicrobium aerolatum]|uniref:DUF6314 family protein n=1 Tax=Rubellimicrobium aerolatum TaxID=490979 RepID=A0ABW0SBD7_9RHOB|nr:DUF6314 family protein [Rubellimicrobium aerolatum]MBP1805534.1 hypothetical protein [Rubellimicrobium aerolatum]
MLHLRDFLGQWRIARIIDDRLGPPGRFDGAARFTPDGEGLRYREEGTLRLGGLTLAAHRDYLWRADEGGIAVLFPDGRPFHRFRPEGRAAGTDHPCGRDLYRVAYDLTSWPDWAAEWTVTGPAKDYTMVSRYRPD